MLQNKMIATKHHLLQTKLPPSVAVKAARPISLSFSEYGYVSQKQILRVSAEACALTHGSGEPLWFFTHFPARYLVAVRFI